MVEIRCFDITQLKPGDYETLYSRASLQRKERADRYRRPEDRVRCIVAEALLRWVPGYDAGDLEYGPTGKPSFRDPQKPRFNLSHAGRWVVIAWGNSPLGVDLEQIRMTDGKESVARQFYCADEQDYVFAAHGKERGLRFFQLWTMKESYLKYLGTGITRSLKSFSALDSGLGVRFHSQFLPDACMTLCTTEDGMNCVMLSRAQLLPEENGYCQYSQNVLY